MRFVLTFIFVLAQVSLIGQDRQAIDFQSIAEEIFQPQAEDINYEGPVRISSIGLQ